MMAIIDLSLCNLKNLFELNTVKEFCFVTLLQLVHILYVIQPNKDRNCFAYLAQQFFFTRI